MNKQPVFVVVEGADGCGKNTVGEMLAEQLEADFMETPPDKMSEARKKIDALYKKCGLAAQLFYASAVAYASQCAEESLKQGRSVVVVRYWPSTLAYNGLVRESEMDDSAWLERITAPHFTCYLRVSAEARRQRMEDRGEGTNETDKRSLEQNEKLEKRYAQVLSEHKERAGRILQIPNDGKIEDCVARALEEIGKGRGLV